MPHEIITASLAIIIIILGTTNICGNTHKQQLFKGKQNNGP